MAFFFSFFSSSLHYVSFQRQHACHCLLLLSIDLHTSTTVIRFTSPCHHFMAPFTHITPIYTYKDSIQNIISLLQIRTMDTLVIIIRQVCDHNLSVEPPYRVGLTLSESFIVFILLSCSEESKLCQHCKFIYACDLIS